MLHASRMRKRSIAAAILGAIALVGSLLVATPAQALNDSGTGGVFVSASGRILDTAKGTGGFSTPMEAGKYRTIKVAGLAGLPEDGSVGAVSLNATVGTTPDNGTLFGRPDADTSRTTMLIYNDHTGEYVSNTATVAVGANGTIQIMTETTARVILDVQGYYTANTDGTSAGGFIPVAGKRVVDTRSGLGTAKATIAPGKSIDVQVAGANSVPSDASGAVVNLIAINSTNLDGNLTPYAADSTRPQNSLHYAPSGTTSVQAQVALSSTGKMTIANSSATVNLVVDLQGYFTAAGKSGASFTPATGRAYNSRATGNTPLAKNETRSVQIAGQAGVPVMGSGITAVVLTLIVSHGGSDGRATVWADGTTRPDTTAINFQTDEIRTNTVTVPLGANGKIDLNNIAEATHYIVDVQGWYVNTMAPKVACPTEYRAGSWTMHSDGSDIVCEVTAHPSADSESYLITLLNDDPIDTVPLTSDNGASVNITIPGTPGWHRVTAIITNAMGDTEEQEFAFGLNATAPSATLTAIENATPESLMDLSSLTKTAGGAVAIQTTEEVAVTVPNNATGGITLDPTATDSASTVLSAALPFAAGATAAVSETAGVVSYNNQNGSSTVPIVHSDGSVQVATVIETAQAPTRFAYPMNLPEGSQIATTEDGALVITDSSGFFIGSLNAPWAKDARGADVPTRYEVEGNTVTQVVDTSNVDSFPVVADPDLWTTIKNVAGCALDIASWTLPAAHAVKTLSKVNKIIKSSKKVIKAYNELGGKLDKVMKSLKKYVANKSSLSKKKVAAWATIIGIVGGMLFDALGIGNCVELVKSFAVKK